MMPVPWGQQQGEDAHTEKRTLLPTCEIRANHRLPLRLTPRNEELPYTRDEEVVVPPVPERSPLRDVEGEAVDEDTAVLLTFDEQAGDFAAAAPTACIPAVRPASLAAALVAECFRL